MVEAEWYELSERFKYVGLDHFVAMPNHVHGIIVLPEDGGHRDTTPAKVEAQVGLVIARQDKRRGTVDGTIGRIIQAFKSLTTLRYIEGVERHNWTPFRNKLWQRNYFEHIIRNEMQLNQVREYIATNPLRWEQDSGNPSVASVRL